MRTRQKRRCSPVNSTASVYCLCRFTDRESFPHETRRGVGTDDRIALQKRNCVTVRAESCRDNVPDELTLLPAYPNPFNPETRLRFSLPKSADVTIQIFDVTGRKINTLLAQQVKAGAHEIRWNATNESGAAVSSGIYFYSIRANAQIKSGKLVLLR